MKKGLAGNRLSIKVAYDQKCTLGLNWNWRISILTFQTLLSNKPQIANY